MELKNTFYQSIWTKDNRICKVNSRANYKNGHPDKIVFTFIGWNPFPCYSMVSTYPVVAKWLTENGWTKMPKELATKYYVANDGELPS